MRNLRGGPDQIGRAINFNARRTLESIVIWLPPERKLRS